ncbi:MAG: tRNA (adenosine(37)-N6)-threonylcarbamoyltransferase complex transferase subunit TsaD [Armatimonadetes bacterium]|nr:tRNA (adenosine(37)-N6)-threonylcarbamoyltransferase complex transferase subunit TsaD [Armatimonadota bacterium]MDW8121753.1 tRNA (adenosine(37)-N6)-threonylcarbamoyltransferase complex transferase subunit TsaD [Armatimonadota bacterium]
MIILGIETSCDETAAAVVKDGTEVLSNVVLSQVAVHQPFGGIVPELASRKQMEFITWVVHQAMEQAKVSFDCLDAIAVTYGPGLIGSLLVGLSFAKGLALSTGLPLIPVHHLEGHLFSAFLKQKDKDGDGFQPPYLCLIVTGGHTELVWMTRVGRYQVLGQTLDDAAGEAFDKGARALGLGFPGGPAIEKAAQGGDESAILFPRATLEGPFDFSFAGLKTSLYRYLKGLEKRLERKVRPTFADICASYQAAIVDMLLQPLERAMEEKEAPALIVVGGVAANQSLRRRLEDLAQKWRARLLIPPPYWCTDNAAMIAAAAFFRLKEGLSQPDLFADADPRAPLPSFSEAVSN